MRQRSLRFRTVHEISYRDAVSLAYHSTYEMFLQSTLFDRAQRNPKLVDVCGTGSLALHWQNPKQLWIPISLFLFSHSHTHTHTHTHTDTHNRLDPLCMHTHVYIHYSHADAYNNMPSHAIPVTVWIIILHVILIVHFTTVNVIFWCLYYLIVHNRSSSYQTQSHAKR